MGDCHSYFNFSARPCRPGVPAYGHRFAVLRRTPHAPPSHARAPVRGSHERLLHLLLDEHDCDARRTLAQWGVKARR